VSALVALVAPHGQLGLLLVDSAGYSMGDGRILAFGAKCFGLPHAESVIAARGPFHTFLVALEAASLMSSFDQIVADLPAAIARALEHPELAEVRESSIELVVMGRSASSRRIAIQIANRVAGAPFEFRPAGSWVAPIIPENALRAAGLDPRRAPPATPLEWSKVMLAILQSQRALADPAKEAIGGAAVFTALELGASGACAVSSTIPWRWADKIGHPMNLQSRAPVQQRRS
jgi:hypothetical protein